MGDLTRNWWLVVLRGVLAVLFGIVCFVRPGISLAALIIVFGVYAFIDGVFAIASAIAGQSGRPWWALVLKGIAGVAAAGITLFWPALTALTLLVVIAVWAIVSGIFEIATAIRLRKVIQSEWLLGLAGVAGIIFGILLIRNPAAGALAVVWLIGIYAIVFGALIIALGFKLRRLHSRVEGVQEEMRKAA